MASFTETPAKATPSGPTTVPEIFPGIFCCSCGSPMATSGTREPGRWFPTGMFAVCCVFARVEQPQISKIPLSQVQGERPMRGESHLRAIKHAPNFDQISDGQPREIRLFHRN